MTTTATTPAKATTADRILDVFRDLPTARVAQITEVTGLSRSTVQDNLKKLALNGDVIRMDVTETVGLTSRPVATYTLTPARKAANKKAAAKIAAAAKKTATKTNMRVVGGSTLVIGATSADADAMAEGVRKVKSRKSQASAVALPEVTVTPTGRRAKGVLDAQILVWMTARRSEMYGPYDVAKGVDAKTGAVHPALERLLGKGLISKPQAERPVRYQAL